MIIFGEISNETVITGMLIASVLMTVFFGVLYFGIHRQKSVLMLFLSSFFQIIIACFLYAEKLTGDMGFLMMANIANVLIVTLWVNAIFLILEVKTKKAIVVALTANAINLIQSFVLYLSTHSNFLVNVISAFIMAFISFYGAVKILSVKEEKKRKEVRYTTAIIGLFGLLNLGRGIHRLFNPMYISSFSQMDTPASLFLVVSLSFSYLMTLTILFLNYNDLVLKVEKLSYTDMLTGALTRKTFFLMFEQKLAEARRGGRNLGIAMLDIDNFKRINDTYGHLMGDKALEHFVRKIKDGLRENDIIGRVGGEEFMIIMEVEKKEEAHTALSRIKESICCCEFVEGEKLTFSCGYMMIDKENGKMQINDIIKIVDQKMYQAKAEGKNRIVG